MNERVLAAVKSERDYQKRRWGEAPHEPAAFLTFMRHWLTRAEEEITKADAPAAAMESVRKITALGIACME